MNAMQDLDDYVWNLGDSRKYWEWESTATHHMFNYPSWSEEQAEAVAFKDVFPELSLPPQFEPKP